MFKKSLVLSSVLAVTMMLLSACNLPVSPSTAETSTPASSGSTEVPVSPTSEPPVVAAAPGDCLIGAWKLTDFSAYMQSISQGISNNSNNAVTITSGEYSGTAMFVFKPDQTIEFSAEDFRQSFTMSTTFSDTTLDIPINLTVNGSSTADYAVDSDRISFSNQVAGDMVVTTEISGNTTTLDSSLLGQPDTIQLYQYSCVDANTLSLKVVAVSSMDLAPFTLTRIH